MRRQPSIPANDAIGNPKLSIPNEARSDARFAPVPSALHPPTFNPHLTKSRLNDGPCLCEMLRRNFRGPRCKLAQEEQSEIILDARRMTNRTGARLAARIIEIPPEKAFPRTFSAALRSPVSCWAAAGRCCQCFGNRRRSRGGQRQCRTRAGSAVTFSARFDALGAAPEGVSVVRKSAPAVEKASDAIRKNYMALLDVTYSLGPPPGSFSATMPRGPDRQLAMLSPDQSDAQNVAPALLPQRAADSVPLPASRPSTLRLLASREVAKAKAAILAVTSAEKPSIFEKLYGKPQAKGSCWPSPPRISATSAFQILQRPARWAMPRPMIARPRCTNFRAHGLPARRQQAGSAFGPRDKARRSALRPCQDARRHAAAYL